MMVWARQQFNAAWRLSLMLSLVFATGTGCSNARPGGHGHGATDPIKTDDSGNTLTITPSTAEANLFEWVEVAASVTDQFGQGVGGILVTFSMRGTETAANEKDGLVLDFSDCTTDAAGQCSVSIYSGSIETSVDVAAQTPAGLDATAWFDVRKLPYGNVHVSYLGTKNMPTIGKVVTWAVPGNKTCSSLSKTNAPANFTREVETAMLSKTVKLLDLTAAQPYAVMALAYTGNIAVARACAEKIIPVAEDTTLLELDMMPFPMDLHGKFTIQTELNMAGLTGGAENTIMEMAAFFHDPGKYLIDKAFDAVGLEGDGLILTSIKDGIADEFADEFSDIGSEYPGIETFMTVADGILGIITRLQVDHFFRIEKVQADGTIAGQTGITGIHFQWGDQTLGFSINDINISAFKLDRYNADFTGQVDYNKLTIFPHELDIEYGKMILYLLYHVILPEVAGVNDLHVFAKNVLAEFAAGDVIANTNLTGCDAVGVALLDIFCVDANGNVKDPDCHDVAWNSIAQYGWDIGLMDIKPSHFAFLCDLAVDALVFTAEKEISEMVLEDRLQMTVKADMVAGADLHTVERLENLKMDGEILNSNGGHTGRFISFTKPSVPMEP